MAEMTEHIRQAAHNERCAQLLLATDDGARDWSITAAFYAAVHLAEAAFFTVGDIVHTEAVELGDLTPHEYRQQKIFERANPAYDSYRKLRQASQSMRYLNKPIRGGGVPSLEYVTVAEAKNFVGKELNTVKTELERAFGIDLH